MQIKIDIPDDLASDLNTVAENAAMEALSAGDKVRLEQMMHALETPNGVAMNCADATAAQAYRFRLYRTRRKAQAAGVKALDDLLIRLEGPVLKILRAPAPTDIVEL